MFNRIRLSDDSELFAHVEAGQLVLANVNGQGKTTWQKAMSVEGARELANFITSQVAL